MELKHSMEEYVEILKQRKGALLESTAMFSVADELRAIHKNGVEETRNAVQKILNAAKCALETRREQGEQVMERFDVIAGGLGYGGVAYVMYLISQAETREVYYLYWSLMCSVLCMFVCLYDEYEKTLHKVFLGRGSIDMLDDHLAEGYTSKIFDQFFALYAVHVSLHNVFLEHYSFLTGTLRRTEIRLRHRFARMDSNFQFLFTTLSSKVVLESQLLKKFAELAHEIDEADRDLRSLHRNSKSRLEREVYIVSDSFIQCQRSFVKKLYSMIFVEGEAHEDYS